MYIEIARYQEHECIWIQQDIKKMNILHFLMDWYIDIARDITTPRQMSMSHELADELWRHVCMHIYVNIYSCMYIDIARDITTPRQMSLSHELADELWRHVCMHIYVNIYIHVCILI